MYNDTMTVTIAMSNVGAKLMNADQKAISIVSDTLSYDVDGAVFSRAYKAGKWNGKQTFLKYPGLIFEAGFVPMVKRALAEAGIAVSIYDTRTRIEIKADEIELDGITLRDYQLEGVAAIERHGRGILQCATGSGKTEIAIAATKRFGLKTLWITHKLDLVRQTRKRFNARLGHPVGMISEGEWLPSNITVATVQTIMSWWRLRWTVKGKNKKGKIVERIVYGDTELKAKKSALKHDFSQVTSITLQRDGREKVLPFLNSIEFLITDEAHRSSANSFFKIILNCRNAYYRASLTATPLMKGNMEDDLKLIACSGDVIHRVTNKDLIDRGILAEPHFRYIEVPGFTLPNGRKVTKKTPYPTAYKTGIVDNEIRNSLIVKETVLLVEQKRQTVVLVKEIRHGERISEMLRKAGISCYWIYGNDNGDVREEALLRLRNRDVNVIVASTIFDEGLDEDSISGLVLAGGGKSQIGLFQRVGRAMRARKGKDLELHGNTAVVVDFLDTGDHRLFRHSKQRYGAVRNEPGWIIDGVERWPASKGSIPVAPARV
jgi:superfamily II DNA or RNA helicase